MGHGHVQQTNSKKTQQKRMIDSMEFKEKIQNSIIIKLFIKFLNEVFPKIKIIFVHIGEGTSLLTCVFWNLDNCESIDFNRNDGWFISLSGTIIKEPPPASDSYLKVKERLLFLEDYSSKNLIKLFESAAAYENGEGVDHLKGLIESLMRLAQVNFDSSSSSRGTSEKDCGDIHNSEIHSSDICSDSHSSHSISSHSGDIHSSDDHNDSHSNNSHSSDRCTHITTEVVDTCTKIHFSSSILIANKTEYPFYIILKGNGDLAELREKLLDDTIDIDEKSEILKQFYNENENEDLEFVELEIFSNLNKSLFYDRPCESQDLKEIIKNLKDQNDDTILGLELELNVKDLNLNFKKLNQIFKEMIEANLPPKKLNNLNRFHSEITRKCENLNADTLLPLLTFVIIMLDDGHEIQSQIRFIERFCNQNLLTGLNNYILTSTNAAIEIIKSLSTSKTKIKSPSHFSNFISSIASLGQNITSTLTLSRSNTSPTTTTATNSEDQILTAFRERMLATNSGNDLMIRDVNLMLEDYKNLLFILYKL